MKLYAVELTKKLYVLADDEVEAEEVADECVCKEATPFDAFAVEVRSVCEIDAEWVTSLPWKDPGLDVPEETCLKVFMRLDSNAGES